MAWRILPRLLSVQPIGSWCLNFRFSGSGLSTIKRTDSDRDARSPRGEILFPLKTWIALAATVRFSDMPRMRSVYISAVRAFSIEGLEIDAPRGILSQAIN